MFLCWRARRIQFSTVSAHWRKTTQTFIAKLEKDGSRVLRAVQSRVDERDRLLRQAGESGTAQDIQRAKQVKDLGQIHNAWNQWTRALESLQETVPLLSDTDPSMRSIALEEYQSLMSTLAHHIATVFPSLLVPPSTTAHLSSLLELKAGVGGSEASLFAADLLRMYLRFANTMDWKTQVLSSRESDGGGLKDAIVEVTGRRSYDDLRWETGIHRVQRVPATESSGRVHTSTVAVLVIPTSSKVDPKHDQDLFSMDDIKIEVMRARGAGGQHVNTTESAVRLTHIPTGVTVSMQDERSQHQNKRRAFQVLSARLMDLKITKDIETRRSARRKLVSTADRSEKIRTYNYAQDRVTDHRIKLTANNLSSVVDGDGLREFIDALRREHLESVMDETLGE